jgi:hypothetical protein
MRRPLLCGVTVKMDREASAGVTVAPPANCT